MCDIKTSSYIIYKSLNPDPNSIKNPCDGNFYYSLSDKSIYIYMCKWIRINIPSNEDLTMEITLESPKPHIESGNHVLFTVTIKNKSTKDEIIRSAFVDNYKDPTITPSLDPNIGWPLRPQETKTISVKQNIGQVGPGQINLIFFVSPNADQHNYSGFISFFV